MLVNEMFLHVVLVTVRCSHSKAWPRTHKNTVRHQRDGKTRRIVVGKYGDMGISMIFYKLSTVIIIQVPFFVYCVGICHLNQCHKIRLD